MPPAHASDDWLAADALAVLPRGMRFYRWLVAEKLARDDAQRIACRPAMKALSRRLLREVLQRRM